MSRALSDLVTVMIPVYNESGNLPACLDAVRDLAHVVLIDSGSTDDTLEIAKRYGREAMAFEWNGQFPKKRNWALQNHAFKTPWVFFLDADEIVTEGVKAELEKTLPDTPHNAFILSYDNWFMGRMLKHGDTMRKSAILRIGKGGYEKIEEHGWSSLPIEVHEHLVAEGTCGTIAARMEHHDRNRLTKYYAKHNEYSDWEANRYMAIADWSVLTQRQRMKYRMIQWKIFPFFYFCASYFAKRGFLDGAAGFYFAIGKMFYFYQIQAKIREIETREKGKDVNGRSGS